MPWIKRKPKDNEPEQTLVADVLPEQPQERHASAVLPFLTPAPVAEAAAPLAPADPVALAPAPIPIAPPAPALAKPPDPAPADSNDLLSLFTDETASNESLLMLTRTLEPVAMPDLMEQVREVRALVRERRGE